jgi:zinc and cadmium transporter
LETSTSLILGSYCVAAFVASLAGGWLPSCLRLTHTRLQLGLSLIAGLMLGVALLHFLPHGIEDAGSVDRAAGWALGGFLTMFFLQRVFHYHQHGVPPAAHHPADHAYEPAPALGRRPAWIGVAAGMALHSLLDGLTLAVAVLAGGEAWPGLVGLGAALAVVLHKPFDAFAVLTLMHASGSRPGLRRAVNIAFALVAPAGAALAVAGLGSATETYRIAVGCALAFCAGGFLCVAGSDLLPELHFHSHDRVRLSLALALGVGVAVGIGWLEHHEGDHDHHDHHHHPHHSHGAVLPPRFQRHASPPGNPLAVAARGRLAPRLLPLPAVRMSTSNA